MQYHKAKKFKMKKYLAALCCHNNTCHAADELIARCRKISCVTHTQTFASWTFLYMAMSWKLAENRLQELIVGTDL